MQSLKQYFFLLRIQEVVALRKSMNFEQSHSRSNL